MSLPQRLRRALLSASEFADELVETISELLLNPDEAARLIEWLLDEEAQRYFADETFEYPLASGVPPSGDLPPATFADVGSIDLVVTGSEKSAQVSQGSSVLVPVKGRIGEYKVRGVFGGFAGFDDQNFFVIAAARPDYWNDWKLRIKAMIDSIRFIDIDYSEMIMGWERRLIGKSLAPQDPVARGPLVPKPINLCSNGTVADEKPAKTQPAAPALQQRVWNGVAWVNVPAAPMPRPPARWSIEPIRGKPTLVILSGPLPQEFVLEMEDDQLLVNGRPYRISENTLCQ